MVIVNNNLFKNLNYQLSQPIAKISISKGKKNQFDF